MQRPNGCELGLTRASRLCPRRLDAATPQEESRRRAGGEQGVCSVYGLEWSTFLCTQNTEQQKLLEACKSVARTSPPAVGQLQFIVVAVVRHSRLLLSRFLLSDFLLKPGSCNAVRSLAAQHGAIYHLKYIISRSQAPQASEHNTSCEPLLSPLSFLEPR